MRILIAIALVVLATSAYAQQPPQATPPAAAPSSSQAPPSAPEPTPTLSPVLVEGPRFFPERRATTEQAREEIQSTVPGGASTRVIRDRLSSAIPSPTWTATTRAAWTSSGPPRRSA